MAAILDWRGFNPTLVRLRQGLPGQPRARRRQFQSHAGSIEAGGPATAIAPLEARFQSHAGSIEACTGSGGMSGKTAFQSHAGSIEAELPPLRRLAGKEGFNPTLVRLRHGTIWIPDLSGAGFNPTLVRLRHRPPGGWGGGSRRVSIPRWFD